MGMKQAEGGVWGMGFWELQLSGAVILISG